MRTGDYGTGVLEGRPYAWLELHVTSSPLPRSHEPVPEEVRAATVVVWLDEDPPGIAIAPGVFTFPEVIIDTGYHTHLHEGVEGVAATAEPCFPDVLGILAERIVDILHDAYRLALLGRCPGPAGHGPIHAQEDCAGVICPECGACPICPGPFPGHLEGCWRYGEETVRIPRAECCRFHNATCEPPSELCCAACTEGRHPDHPRGEVCTWKRPVGWFSDHP